MSLGLSAGAGEWRHYSKAKMRFQSSFTRMTVQPCFFASSSSTWVKVPILLSGSPSAGP
jgi:hypothetical protein